MNKPPAFQFYPGDWLASTAITLMSPAEEGAYIRLLCYCWNDPDCSLPDDDKLMATLSRLNNNMPITNIKKCFIPHPRKPGFLTNERLLKEREKQNNWRRISSLGGHAKWKSDGKNKLLRSQRLKVAMEKGTHNKEEWEEMKTFFGNSCVRCGVRFPESSLVKDHIIPIYQGGDDSVGNIQPFCRKCSSSKGSDTTDFRPNACQMPAVMPTKWLPQRLPNACTSSSSSSSFNNNIYSSDSVEHKLATFLLELILQRNNSFKQPSIQYWAKTINRMLRIDKRNYAEVKEVIAWCQADSFWQNNILSADKLRKQYDRLKMQMKARNKSKQESVSHYPSVQELERRSADYEVKRKNTVHAQ